MNVQKLRERIQRGSSIAALFLILATPVAAHGVDRDFDHDGLLDEHDPCPFHANEMGAFLGLPGCSDKDNDGFEDMIWDRCPGAFGHDVGCPMAGEYKLLAQADGTTGVPIDEGIPQCYASLPKGVVKSGDILMFMVDTDDGAPVISNPINIE